MPMREKGIVLVTQGLLKENDPIIVHHALVQDPGREIEEVVDMRDTIQSQGQGQGQDQDQ